MEFTSQSIAAFLMIGSTAIAYFQFQKAANWNKWVGAAMALWLMVQMILAQRGFYSDTTATPPRFPLLLIPPILVTIAAFTVPFLKKGVHKIELKYLVWVHIVRIPVEIALHQLYLAGWVPQIMTYEGNNFDIISGITAPFIAYFGYNKQTLPQWVLITWNLVCLGLLFNIVITAIFSAPTPFQQLAFDQPNIAVTQFPFVWLPCFIVPVVLFAHLKALFTSAKNN
jgi:hypothetical protein